jgi:hypothetical protein
MIRSTEEMAKKKATSITSVVLYIGGVPLTNGRDSLARKRAATNLKLQLAEMQDRHHRRGHDHHSIRHDARVPQSIEVPPNVEAK